MIRARGRDRNETPRNDRDGMGQSVDNLVDKSFQPEDKNDPVDNTASFQENPSENRQLFNITTILFPDS